MEIATPDTPMIHRFYAPDLMARVSVELTGTEAHHAIHVLRLHAGDAIELFDGAGKFQQATIRTVKRHSIICDLLGSPTETPRTLSPLTLAAPLPKGDRQRILVEKLTELGVERLIPLITERGVAQPTPEAIQRLEAIVIAACKQSKRNWLMKIEMAQPVAAVCQTIASEPARVGLIADVRHDAAGAPTSGERTRWPSSREMVGLIGPEGGWTDREREMALAAGCQLIRLGPHTLRVETAAIALAAIAQWHCHQICRESKT